MNASEAASVSPNELFFGVTSSKVVQITPPPPFIFPRSNNLWLFLLVKNNDI